MQLLVLGPLGQHASGLSGAVDGCHGEVRISHLLPGFHLLIAYKAPCEANFPSWENPDGHGGYHARSKRTPKNITLNLKPFLVFSSPLNILFNDEPVRREPVHLLLGVAEDDSLSPSDSKH